MAEVCPWQGGGGCGAGGLALCSQQPRLAAADRCRVVDTVLVDQETIYLPRHGDDRLLLGLKGTLNEYELDLLRQRSLAARYENACRGELVVAAPVVAAPVGFVKAGDRLEKDPDRRVQEAIRLVFDKVAELGSAVRRCCGSRSTGSTCPPGAPAARSSGAGRATRPFTGW